MILVAPSILSANFTILGEEIRQVELAGADWLHVDVMDGHFVPNLTIGPQVVADIRKVTGLFLDVHLMIEKPDQLIPAFAQAGAQLITVHLEACTHLHRVVAMIKDLGVQAGVALNPGTPAHLLESILPDVDLVLAMSVNPGFGGQRFIPNVIRKVRELQGMICRQQPLCHLQVDGGMNQETGLAVIEAGCDILVAGSYIFGAADRVAAVRALKSLGSA